MPVTRVTAAACEPVRTAACHSCGMPFAVDRRGQWAGCWAIVETIGRYRQNAVVLYYHTYCWARRHPSVPGPGGRNGRR
jgi:hypothetical protein